MDSHPSQRAGGTHAFSSAYHHHHSHIHDPNHHHHGGIGIGGASHIQNRGAKASQISHTNPGLPPRTNFMQWDDADFPSPMEGSGMKRTASYSSFLSKKSGSFYKPILQQHARAMSGQSLSQDMYPAPADDSPPTTLTKTPTYEYYGFVLYLVSGITYVMYLGWAYLPKEILDSMGITYYPSKYWSLALPIWLFVLVIYLYVAFFAFNLYNTEPLDSFLTITDEHANAFHTNSASTLTDDFVPDLMDIPIGMVNACLYQHIEGISDDEEDGEVMDDDDDDDDDDYDGSYIDDTNPSDWDDTDL
ncbi:hypothetical protein BGW38_004990 [Lunasporangiospora selenospora]|uniref:PIG-P domain-containing protein n=1 Tax=Lunasporangiospora selenospora TaxID=979761 RepID=A0A9P6G0Z6_9FUNG|nr:hypothetical protein BGW38_004990 [Lunasporangiospora selenospora]